MPAPPPLPSPVRAVPARPYTTYPSNVPARPRPTGPAFPAVRAVPSTNSLVRPSYPAVTVTPQPRPLLEPFPLVFDNDVKEVEAEAGQTNVTIKFRFTNTSPAEVTISRVHTSCGCSTAKLPQLPWKLPAGTNSEFDVVMDLRGKRGQLNKMAYIYTDRSFKPLTLRVKIPDATPALTGDRLRNLQIAAADRQAIFKGDCATCHSEPGKGKLGRELFQAVCSICHEAEHRAAMVPDLDELRHPTDRAYWLQWASYGKAGTLMPAFAESEGGSLSKAQMDSLVDYLLERFPAGHTRAPPRVGPPGPAPGTNRAVRLPTY